MVGGQNREISQVKRVVIKNAVVKGQVKQTKKEDYRTNLFLFFSDSFLY